MKFNLPCGCCIYDTEEVTTIRGKHIMGGRLVPCPNTQRTFVVEIERPREPIVSVRETTKRINDG